MKRDMDLIRAILLHIEARDDLKFDIAEYDNQVIAYHVRSLVEADLLQGVACHVVTAGPIILEDCHVHLTWKGHEFLDAARDNDRWNQAKNLVRDKAGSITVLLMQELLVALMKRSLGF